MSPAGRAADRAGSAKDANTNSSSSSHELESRIAVALDAFHVVQLGTAALVRSAGASSRRPWAIAAARGSALRDPEHAALRRRATDGQAEGPATAFDADERYEEVQVAWQRAQQLRAAYNTTNLAEGKKIAEKILASFPTCPIPDIKRLGQTLKRWRRRSWRTSTPAARTTAGPKPSTGLIELHRRVARGFRNRDNCRLRMLLIGGGLTSPHLR